MTSSGITLYDSNGIAVFRGTQSPGGGSQPGAVRIIRHDFDFSQAVALAAGVTVYTPAVDDLLLDFWFESDAEWVTDVTGALGEIGIISAGVWDDPGGFFNRVAQSSLPDFTSGVWTLGTNVAYIGTGSSINLMMLDAMIAGGVGSAGAAVSDPRVRFRTTEPLKLVVNDDGQPGGTATDAASGTGSLYLAVCTPDTA